MARIFNQRRWKLQPLVERIISNSVFHSVVAVFLYQNSLIFQIRAKVLNALFLLFRGTIYNMNCIFFQNQIKSHVKISCVRNTLGAMMFKVITLITQKENPRSICGFNIGFNLNLRCLNSSRASSSTVYCLICLAQFATDVE